MPISHKHKLIFVHIPKTAGSSVEASLGIRGVDNHGSVTPSKDILFGSKEFKIFSRIFHHDVYQHKSLPQIKRIVGQRIFKEYFKFAFVRNPYDRVVSDYCWHNTKMTFKDFLLKQVKPRKNQLLQRGPYDDHFYDQHKFICDKKGKILVDFLGRFENLDEDFHKLCRLRRLNLTLGEVNGRKRNHYRTYYDSETKRICYQIYQKDFELFGYDF